jgi:hypothetical protein
VINSTTTKWRAVCIKSELDEVRRLGVGSHVRSNVYKLLAMVGRLTLLHSLGTRISAVVVESSIILIHTEQRLEEIHQCSLTSTRRTSQNIRRITAMASEQATEEVACITIAVSAEHLGE